MKRTRLFWFLISLCGLTLVSGITGILTFHQLSSNGLLPNYTIREWVISSTLKKYGYNDVVCFKRTPNHQVEFLRLLAIADDSVEMKDGYILRNGILADDPEKLVFSYFTRKEIKDFSKFENLTLAPKQIGDTVIFNLTYVEYKDLSRQYLLRLYHPTLNNFHPIMIQKGYCMLCADNRSLASNKNGPKLVPLKCIVGAVVW